MPMVRTDPYPAYRFQLESDGVPLGGFSEVHGLSIEVDVILVRSGADPGAARKLPGLPRFGDVTLRRGATGNPDLFRWMKSVTDGRPERRNLVLTIMTEDGEPGMRWLLGDAFPRRLALGPLLAGSSSILVEELVLAIGRLELGD